MVYGNCKQGATESYSDCTQEKKRLRALQYLNIVISQWDQGKIGIELGTKHDIYLKLASFT